VLSFETCSAVEVPRGFRSVPHGEPAPQKSTSSSRCDRVYPAFLRGEYDTAVFQAFREIEVAVRRAAKFPGELVGITLMRQAFRPVDSQKPSITPGLLTDTALPIAEQEAMANLFSSAIGLYKNPQSHRNVATKPTEAAEVIVFARHLLQIIDRLSLPPLSP
jgi:uncharacterized protein (TIGR02391 family)